MGRIYQRTGRRGELLPALWLDYYNAQGERIRESSGTTSQKEAERLLKLREGKVAAGERVVAKRATWDELRDNLLADYRATGKRDVTEASYRIAHLDRHFSGVRADLIDGRAVADYITKRRTEVRVSPVPGLRKTPSAGTVNREVAILLRALRLGVEQGRLAKVPVVHLAEENGPRQGFLAPHEFEAIRSHLPADVAVAATLLYDNAARLREVTHLQRKHVDLAEGCLRYRQSKTGQPIAVYLRPETLDMLRAHLDRVRELERSLGKVLPMVFPIVPGTGISKRLVGTQRDSFERVWQRACEQAGYPGRLVHDLRRSGIRELVRAGVPERVAMDISGHRTRSTFDRYNITSEEDLQAAAAKLDAARRKATGATGGTVRTLRAAR